MTLLEELQWRGLVASTSGDLNNILNTPTTFYVGTDPTGKSLHVGHLLAFIVAKLLQKNGHKPIILVGGATASLGDPSFKAEERKLLTMDEIMANAENIKKQLSHLIDFNSTDKNAAIMVNNYDYMKDMSFLDFARNVGKLITINYMIAKDSVQSRLAREGSGLSFTEFTYQLLQGYDFQQLNEKFGCTLQIGGSDQFGNAMTGLEIIRKSGGDSSKCGVLTWPLVTRADGTKFGKSEGGKNIWLDSSLTSPYEFYQFWLNQSDSDAEKFIKMFTLLNKEDIIQLIEEHQKAPHLRLLQKTLAYEVTSMVHSKSEADLAVEVSNVLYDKTATIETFKKFDEPTFVSIFNSVPQFKVSKNFISTNPSFIDLSVECGFAKSKGDARRNIINGAYSMNKTKISSIDTSVNDNCLLHNKYIMLQNGKKYSLVTVES